MDLCAYKNFQFKCRIWSEIVGIYVLNSGGRCGKNLLSLSTLDYPTTLCRVAAFFILNLSLRFGT